MSKDALAININPMTQKKTFKHGAEGNTSLNYLSLDFRFGPINHMFFCVIVVMKQFLRVICPFSTQCWKIKTKKGKICKADK